MTPALHDELRDVPIPGEAEAAERSRRVVLAAHAARRGSRRRPAPLRAAVALAALAAVVAVALTPPGAAVADWVEDVVRPGNDDAAPVLQALPAPGRLLVDSPAGPWVVQADGSRRRLGQYQSASWSPQGRFVAVTRDLELLAVEPDGDVRWSLAADAPVAAARWAPNGLRIAYLSGSTLWLVDGDGTPDELLARRVSPVAPAWRPSAPQELAYADTAGRVRVVEPESRTERWRSRAGGAPPLQLDWSADGRRLLVRTPAEVRVHAADGRLLRRIRTRAVAAAWSPRGDRVALAGDGAVRVARVDGGAVRRVFSGEGRFTSVAWSPDGRWLALAWPDADQWLFIRSAAVGRIEAVGGVSRQFGSGGRPGFADLAEWCC